MIADHKVTDDFAKISNLYPCIAEKGVDKPSPNDNVCLRVYPG